MKDLLEQAFEAGKLWERYQLRYTDSALDFEAWYEQSHKLPVMRGGDKVRESVRSVEEYLEWLKGNDTPNTPLTNGVKLKDLESKSQPESRERKQPE
jgi:phage terminase Nu1 subunit (DNA packaging protein)